MPEPDIFDRLKLDHREIQTQLEYLIADCRDEKEIAPERLFRLNRQLTLHCYIEELLIYPQAELERPIADRLETAYLEHQRIRDALYQMGEAVDLDTLARRCEDTLHLLAAHLPEEETILFPVLRQRWGSATLRALAEQMSLLQDYSPLR